MSEPFCRIRTERLKRSVSIYAMRSTCVITSCLRGNLSSIPYVCMPRAYTFRPFRQMLFLISSQIVYQPGILVKVLYL